MRYIKFKYRDEYTNGEWREQECQMGSLKECIKMYGLDDGSCEYKILEDMSDEEYLEKLKREGKEEME